MGIGDFMKENWVEIGIVGFLAWFFFGSKRGKTIRDKFLARLRDSLDGYLEGAEEPKATRRR